MQAVCQMSLHEAMQAVDEGAGIMLSKSNSARQLSNLSWRLPIEIELLLCSRFESLEPIHKCHN